MSNYISNYSGSQIDNVIDLFHEKGLDQVTGLVQRNADGTFSQGSGGGGSDVFIAECNVTTYAELLTAINADKRIIIKKTEDGSSNDVLYYVNKYRLLENDGQPYSIVLDASTLPHTSKRTVFVPLVPRSTPITYSIRFYSPCK